MSIDVPAPWLVALRGHPRSGKSTVGAALSREFRWPIVDKDEIQDTLDQHLAATDGPAYEIMLGVARIQPLQGISVRLLDCGFRPAVGTDLAAQISPRRDSDSRSSAQRPQWVRLPGVAFGAGRLARSPFRARSD